MNMLLLAAKDVSGRAAETLSEEISVFSSARGSETVDTILASIRLTSVFANTVEQNMDMDTINTAYSKCLVF
ncbi:hypothetical protein AB1A65_09005 [Muricauda sp. ANG21]|jgi:hypothetical protein|uniref:hypothetical protein n=1 Tax=Allomuricauda sp. ANG21 TaxID=3042468 RepID=UPI0034530289